MIDGGAITGDLYYGVEINQFGGNSNIEFKSGVIDGTTYGIENSGTLNFYDGTINGASAVNGTITTRADGYVIRTTTVDSKERYYLSA